MLYDYIGAPFLPGECPSGHDKDRSMCQDDFDKMATHAGLKVDSIAPPSLSHVMEDPGGRGWQWRVFAEEKIQDDRDVPGKRKGAPAGGKMMTQSRRVGAYILSTPGMKTSSSAIHATASLSDSLPNPLVSCSSSSLSNRCVLRSPLVCLPSPSFSIFV